MLRFIIIFSLCSLLNVMLNTIKTIIMYKNEKLSSSLINAITYGFYTIVVVLMAGDMALWVKVLITAVTNFIGVWLSIAILDKFRKDKLWEVKLTAKNNESEEIKILLTSANLPFSTIPCNNGKYTIFNIYCATQKESIAVKEIVKQFKVKYFVSESKTL